MVAEPESIDPASAMGHAMSDIVSAAADAAANRVLQQAAIARKEVEHELERLTEERTTMIKEVSSQVAAASAKADLQLAQHTMEELARFGSIERQMTIAAAQMSASAVSLAQIATDVKSLLASRSFAQGAWKMVTFLITAAAAGAALLTTFLQNKWPWTNH